MKISTTFAVSGRVMRPSRTSAAAPAGNPSHAFLFYNYWHVKGTSITATFWSTLQSYCCIVCCYLLKHTIVFLTRIILTWIPFWKKAQIWGATSSQAFPIVLSLSSSSNVIFAWRQYKKCESTGVRCCMLWFTIESIHNYPTTYMKNVICFTSKRHANN